MRFKVGDKVRKVGGNKKIFYYIQDTRRSTYGMNQYLLDDWFFEDEIEPIEDPLVTKIEERNNKPVKMISAENLLNENDPVDRPTHYESGGKDLFDELYDRLYHSKKMFTGREVFIIVMKFVAERYTRRYPNKNAEDLSKGIYTLERLRGYEELEE